MSIALEDLSVIRDMVTRKGSSDTTDVLTPINKIMTTILEEVSIIQTGINALIINPGESLDGALEGRFVKLREFS